MKRLVSLAALLALGSSSVVTGQAFTVSGAGGSVPDRPFGSGPLWNEAPNWSAFTSTVSVPAPVASITHVVLVGFNHDAKHEVHAFLTNPAGTRFNVIVRPGFDGASNDYGDFLSGNYDIVQSGGSGVWGCCQTDISPGIYDQYLSPPGGGWTNTTTFPISNTPLNAITGGAGTWSLTIYDWESEQIGLLPPSQLNGWQLQGQFLTGPPPPVPICSPGNDGIIACPCGNFPSGPGRGCNNSSNTGGAFLIVTGVASVSADTIQFITGDEKPVALSIVLQGDEEIGAGLTFGDGVRCAGENLKRMYTKNAVGGSITAPTGSELSVTARSAQLGAPILPGVERRYQVMYRDPAPLFGCPGPSGSRFNITAGIRLPWGF